jgi:hypothetical protein
VAVKERVAEEMYTGIFESWRGYDLMEHLPTVGKNAIEFRVCQRVKRIANEFPLEVVDLEVRVEYMGKAK